MKIVIIGVGGVGGYLGGLLAKNGQDVTFVTRKKQCQFLIKNGLLVESVDDNFHLQSIRVTDSFADIGSSDLILITTKTYNLLEVANQLKKVVNDSAVIITMQNGLNSDLIVKDIISGVKVIPGVAYIVSEKVGYNKIQQTAGPRKFIFGTRTQGREIDYLKDIEQLFKRSGILANLVDNIEFHLWKKFLWIITFAGMTSLCRSSIGPIVNNEKIYQLYLDCLEEGLKVAQAIGIKSIDRIKSEIIKKSEEYKTIGCHAKSSMLIDMEKGGKTEIDALNGCLVQIASELEIDVPINRCITAVVKMS